jgi:glycosyltransferase involved in cell wall biosynthesis
MNTALISICIPTYNGGAFLDETLDSIFHQTYKNIEIVFSDDNSKDNTLDIIENFKARANFPVHVEHHKPNGIGSNWNNTIHFANGEFIKFLFQDDILEPTCIEKMVEVMNSQPSLGFVATKRSFIIEGTSTPEIEMWIRTYGNLQSQFEKQEKLTLLNKDLFKRSDFFSDPRNKIGEPPTVLFRKSIINEVGYFDENLEQILDYVFYYRILKKFPIAIINQPLVKFRIHPAQASHVNRSRKIPDYEEYDRILYTEFLPLLHKRQRNRLRKVFNKPFTFRRLMINNIKRILGK